MASSAATSAAPPATSCLRATVVTAGFVVTSIAAPAILYWRFVATLACQACTNSSTHLRPSFASLVDHIVTIVSQGIADFIAVPLFGRPVANASLFLLLAWVYTPFVLAGVYWYVLVRLRRVDLLRVTLEAAPLAFLLYAVLVAPGLFKVNIEDTDYAIMSTLLEAAIFPVVIVILAVTFGQFFARWNLARTQDSLPWYSGIGMFLVVSGVIVGSVFLLGWIWAILYSTLHSTYPHFQSDPNFQAGGPIMVTLIFQWAPAIGIIALVARNTLRAISPRTPTILPSRVARRYSALSALGGALVAIGFFCLWYELSGGILNVDPGNGATLPISTVQPTGADLSATSAPTLLAGMLILGIAALASTLGIAGAGRQTSRTWTSVLLAGSVVCATIVGSELAHFSSQLHAYLVGSGYGAWLTMIGLGLTLCSSLLLLFLGGWRRGAVGAADAQPSAT
jgi:hypothetical protein